MPDNKNGQQDREGRMSQDWLLASADALAGKVIENLAAHRLLAVHCKWIINAVWPGDDDGRTPCRLLHPRIGGARHQVKQREQKDQSQRITEYDRGLAPDPIGEMTE